MVERWIFKSVFPLVRQHSAKIGEQAVIWPLSMEMADEMPGY